MGLHGGKESACQCRRCKRCGFDPWGRSPGEGNVNPLQCSCLGNPTHRGAWQPTVHGVTKNQTQLSDFHFTFPGGTVVKNSPINAGDSGSVPGLGRSHGEGNGNPLQCSCLGNSMDRGAWKAIVHGVTKESDTT